MGQTQFRSDDTVKWWLGFGDGSDGDYSSSGNATDAPIDSSCSGTAGSKSLSATNASFASGKPVLIHQTRGNGAGNWELNQIDSYTAGIITLKKALQNTYTDSGASQAQVIQLKQYKSFTQNSGHTLTAKAWNGDVGGIIAFFAKGVVTITGNININGSNGGLNSAGASGGGFRGGDTINSATGGGYCGEGTGGDKNISRGINSNGSGGGGAGDKDQGAAGGGNGTAGQNGPINYPSNGGDVSGNAALTLMTMGGGGGASLRNDQTYGAGASGGGICLIIANSITISGLINLNGGVGGNGYQYNDGGSGAGGSCLIKCKTGTLGSNKITASGGAAPGAGGAGGVGRIHIDYSGSYTGTTSPTLDATNDITIVDVGGSSAWFMFM